MMKKILLMAALICGVLGFNSCSEDKEDPITVSISGTSYTLPNEDGASVTITATTSAPMRSNVTVPFTISGGTQGSDYKLSAEAFNFKTGESSASIEVSRANATAQLSLTLNLGTPSISDVLLGTVNYCTITVVGSNIYTFSDSNDKLAMDKSIAIELETASGSSFSYASAIEIPIEVVASGTTAEEGTHYKFVDDKKVAKFEAGSSKGYVSLTFLKLESGKDQVTLKVSDSANLYAGNNPTIRIKIVGPTDFSGTWAYEKITNEAWLLSNMGTPALSTIITGNENDDQFTLDGDNGNYKFVPNFKGKLKNYFTAEGKAVANGVRNERLQEEGGLKPPTKELTVLDIENINLNMSETDKTIGKYSVAVSIVRNDDGEERLWMTIYQYRPTENTVYGDWGMTWKDIVEMMDYDSYDGDPNSMETSPIRIYFKRVQE
jgi:hypothetical protein